MFYQLPTGRVIEISTEQYFEMSDEELEYLIAYNYGDIVENPWYGSILHKSSKVKDPPEEEPSDLTNVPQTEKLTDLDMETEED